MTVLFVYALSAVIVAALLFFAVVALLPDGLSVTPQRDERPFELPQDRPMVAGDIDNVRIPVALRGYRFAETDDLIDRLATEIAYRDAEIARLRELDVDESADPAASGAGCSSDDAIPANEIHIQAEETHTPGGKPKPTGEDARIQQADERVQPSDARRQQADAQIQREV